jgi:hypothetical protein
MIPLTVPEIKRLLAEALTRPHLRGHTAAGSPGDAATRPDHAGITSAHR